MNTKKSIFGCISILGVAIALGVGGRYLSRQIIGKELTPIDAAQVIPESALFATFIETDSQKWSQVKALGNDQSQKLLDAQIKELQTELATESADFDYQQDIQPWLDGAMFAVVSEDLTKPDSNMLIVLGIKNKFKANNFVKKLQETSQAKLEADKYKGVKITEATTKDNDVTISALLGNRLLLAQERAVIEQAIDAYQEDFSLASDPQTQKVFEQKLDVGTTLAQVYFPNYGELLEEAFAIDADVPSLYSDLLSMYTSVDSSAIALGVESQGLRVQSVTKFNSDEFSQYLTTNKSKLLKHFPDRTVALINGHGIGQFWEQLLVNLKQNRDTNRYLNLANLAVRQNTNLNLESDIFNWMDGEFAFGIMTTPKSLHPQVNIGLSAGLILETSQPEKAKKTLARLETSAQKHLAIAPIENKINKKAVTQWRAPGVEGALNYGWLDKNNLLLTWDDFSYESISDSKKKSIAKSKNFKAATKKTRDRNLGYFYIDVAQVMNTINQLPIPKSKRKADEAAMAVLNSVESVGSSAVMSDKRTVQQDIYVMFKDN